jgi:hypothetical protein
MLDSQSVAAHGSLATFILVCEDHAFDKQDHVSNDTQDAHTHIYTNIPVIFARKITWATTHKTHNTHTHTYKYFCAFCTQNYVSNETQTPQTHNTHTHTTLWMFFSRRITFNGTKNTQAYIHKLRSMKHKTHRHTYTHTHTQLARTLEIFASGIAGVLQPCARTHTHTHTHVCNAYKASQNAVDVCKQNNMRDYTHFAHTHAFG